jgi:hypothetical protein
MPATDSFVKAFLNEFNLKVGSSLFRENERRQEGPSRTPRTFPRRGAGIAPVSRDLELLPVLEANSGMYGDLQGIAGQSSQEI